MSVSGRPVLGAVTCDVSYGSDSTNLNVSIGPLSGALRPMRGQVPTANFFQRSGYERNPAASRNNTVAWLLAVTDARMDSGVLAQGARDLAAVF